MAFDLAAYIKKRQDAATRAIELGRQQAARVEAASIPPVPPGGGGGAAGPTPFAQTKGGLIFRAEQDRQLLAAQRVSAQELERVRARNALIYQQREQAFETKQLDKRLAEERKVRAEERERVRQSNIRQLRVERQTAFVEMVKSGDVVRAVMFARGFGPENDAFDVRARGLGTSVKALRGARRFERTTEQALSAVLGRQVGISRQGVRGLGAAIGSARAFVQGGADIQTLLTSAFGVGSLKRGERPGMGAERLAELIQQVTPTGFQ